MTLSILPPKKPATPPYKTPITRFINAAETGVLAIQQVEDEKREQKELEKANKKNKD